jgi:hypothetical protein
MSVGDIFTLESVRWDWFVSCTVSHRGATDVFLKRKAFALLRRIARDQGVWFPKLPFALRIESGIDPDHRHFHFLVGSLRSVEQGSRFKTMAFWDKLLGSAPGRVRGTCRVRLYDPAAGLAGYLAKELNAAEAQAWGNGEVILLRAAWRIAWHKHKSVPVVGLCVGA